MLLLLKMPTRLMIKTDVLKIVTDRAMLLNPERPKSEWNTFITKS